MWRLDLKNEERLVRRVTHLQAILAWADEVPKQERFQQAAAIAQEQLRHALSVAHKVLADREPKAQDKLLSVPDVDARCGKHGDFYDGYLLDVAIDADSELITGVNMLPANGDEGADATHLIAQEEQAHGNDVEAVSIDGAGFRGELLRELTDPHPAIERKLSELVRRHDVRHARYRGQDRVLRQGILTALVVNLKRRVRLLTDRLTHTIDPPPTTGIVRAELVKAG